MVDAGLLVRRLALPLALLFLESCAHVTNSNQALCAGATASDAPCRYDPDSGYRLIADKRHDNTLVFVTFSGGGIRATALAYGTLAALGQLDGVNGGESLLDDVDLISSVSGGSVTAGWYALRGKEGLANPDNDLKQFLYDGMTTQLVVNGLNPASVAAYAATPYQRSDVLAGVFENRLFRNATYADVESRYRADHQPYVILNATDIGHETRFPFTQNRFDLLCSDLEKYKLSNAVAASANFPIVFSPIGLQNYSTRCAAHDGTWKSSGPPRWIWPEIDRFDAAQSSDDKPAPRSNGLLELRQARVAVDYVAPRKGDEIIHLMDGGLIDNLGIQSTLALDDEPMCSPGLFQRLAQPRPPTYKAVKDVIIIVVNARTIDPTTIDDTVYPPGVINSLLRVIDSPLASSVLDMQNYLTAELQAIAAWAPDYNRPPGTTSDRKNCWVQPAGGHPGSTASPAPRAQRQADAIGTLLEPKLKFHIVSIDFETIPNKKCREHFWTLDTSWNLQPKDIQDLIKIPYIMLRRSLDLQSAYEDIAQDHPGYKGSVTSPYRDPKAFPDTFAEICNQY